MRRISAAAIALVLATAVCAGCASGRVRQGVEYQDSRRSYLRVLKNWTRTAERFDGLETDAIITATYFSEAMRRAYIGERTRAESLPPEEAGRLLGETLDEHGQAIRFRVTLFTTDRSWNDLERADSSWRVYLIATDGSQVNPVSIRRRRIRRRAEEFYFPQTNSWSRTYDVLFPRNDASGQPLISESEGAFGLLIASPRARARLGWSFE